MKLKRKLRTEKELKVKQRIKNKLPKLSLKKLEEIAEIMDCYEIAKKQDHKLTLREYITLHRNKQ